ncbi:ATP-binding cassette domain-containing protein [Salinispira pacifica]
MSPQTQSPQSNLTDRQPLLSVRDLVKTFGAVRAVDGVSLDLFEEEVVGVIGDNGAGKSTFLSLLAGFHRPDSGRFFHRGEPVAITSPRTSRNRLRIEMIYQNLELAPDLTVWENLFLGQELRRFGGFNDRSSMSERAAEVLERLNTKIKPNDTVGELSGGEKQAVAIGRALLFERDIVIMDEPTAAISVQKVDDVLDLIRRLKSVGKTVILVSHRLEDELAVSDRIVVFWHGRIRTILQNDGLEVNDLIHQMF